MNASTCVAIATKPNATHRLCQSACANDDDDDDDDDEEEEEDEKEEEDEVCSQDGSASTST